MIAVDDADTINLLNTHAEAVVSLVLLARILRVGLPDRFENDRKQQLCTLKILILIPHHLAPVPTGHISTPMINSRKNAEVFFYPFNLH